MQAGAVQWAHAPCGVIEAMEIKVLFDNRELATLALERYSYLSRSSDVSDNDDDPCLQGTTIVAEKALHRFLSDARGLWALFSFTKSKHCEENVLFWYSIERYRLLHTPRRSFINSDDHPSTKMARVITDTFVKSSATYSVNLDDEVVCSIVDTLAAFSPSQEDHAAVLGGSGSIEAHLSTERIGQDGDTPPGEGECQETDDDTLSDNTDASNSVSSEPGADGRDVPDDKGGGETQGDNDGGDDGVASSLLTSSAPLLLLDESLFDKAQMAVEGLILANFRASFFCGEPIREFEEAIKTETFLKFVASKVPEIDLGVEITPSSSDVAPSTRQQKLSRVASMKRLLRKSKRMKDNDVEKPKGGNPPIESKGKSHSKESLKAEKSPVLRGKKSPSLRISEGSRKRRSMDSSTSPNPQLLGDTAWNSDTSLDEQTPASGEFRMKRSSTGETLVSEAADGDPRPRPAGTLTKQKSFDKNKNWGISLDKMVRKVRRKPKETKGRPRSNTTSSLEDVEAIRDLIGSSSSEDLEGSSRLGEEGDTTLPVTGAGTDVDIQNFADADDDDFIVVSSIFLGPEVAGARLDPPNPSESEPANMDHTLKPARQSRASLNTVDGFGGGVLRDVAEAGGCADEERCCVEEAKEYGNDAGGGEKREERRGEGADGSGSNWDDTKALSAIPIAPVFVPRPPPSQVPPPTPFSVRPLSCPSPSRVRPVRPPRLTSYASSTPSPPSSPNVSVRSASSVPRRPDRPERPPRSSTDPTAAPSTVAAPGMTPSPASSPRTAPIRPPRRPPPPVPSPPLRRASDGNSSRVSQPRPPTLSLTGLRTQLPQSSSLGSGPSGSRTARAALPSPSERNPKRPESPPSQS